MTRRRSAPVAGGDSGCVATARAAQCGLAAAMRRRDTSCLSLEALKGGGARSEPGERGSIRHTVSRRTVLAAAAGAVLALSTRAGRAQEAGRTYRIAFLALGPRSQSHFAAVFDELSRHGFVEGANLVVEPRGFGVAEAAMEELAVDLVARRPDVIQAAGDAAIRAAQRATTTIPIIAVADDLLGSRLIASLARPGGNTTGISILAPELDGKRQEILIEALPGRRRTAILTASDRTDQLRSLQEAARLRGVTLLVYSVGDKREDIAQAIETAKADGAEAINVLASPVLNRHRSLILERVALARLPAMFQWPEYAEEGALLAYGPRFDGVFRQAARQLARVLAGTKPGDIPVEQPTTFELVINLKTAKALGLSIPPALLTRADKVIE
jgi:putative ABC transport system substrate-binding protein